MSCCTMKGAEMESLGWWPRGRFAERRWFLRRRMRQKAQSARRARRRGKPTPRPMPRPSARAWRLLCKTGVVAAVGEDEGDALVAGGAVDEALVLVEEVVEDRVT